MALKFLGRGSGFADDHTSAYFTTDQKELVIIDCSMLTFQKLKQFNLKDYEKIYVLVTHTHGDHISGLGLFVQYGFFVLKNNITIIAPSKEVRDDIFTVLTIEDNEPCWFELLQVKDIKEKEWFNKCIITQHTPGLNNKCFGYQLTIDGINVVYTGDTKVLEPFIPYLSNGSNLYVDTSVYYGGVHLKLENVLEDFMQLVNRGVKIYLMHLDNVDAAEKIVEDYDGIEVVTLG